MFNGMDKVLRSRICILVLIGLLPVSCTRQQAQKESVSNETHQYTPTWESLTQHPDPGWFDDAKFGVYWHWGPYAVPAFGHEWYPRKMYMDQDFSRGNYFQYHLEHFGNPAEFGYKDFVPYFTAEKFDADRWADLLAKSGAKFAGPVGQHHDGFAMWDSDLTEWDAKDKGPKQDIMGELAKAIRARGLKFMVSFHHTRKWWYYEPSYAGNYDTKDPAYAGAHKIYPPVHKPGDPPTEAYMQDWEDRVEEVIDKYQPDLLWFDRGLNVENFFRSALPRFREHVKRFLAYYYNHAEAWGREVGVTYKLQDLPEGAGILDLERGRMDTLSHRKWLTDTSVMKNSWCYVQHPDYKSVNDLIDVLVDIVSKNGNMLLDIGPRPDGTIPPTQRAQLLGIGEWLDINGEAIYGTRPWIVYGEGPTQLGGGMFSERHERVYTNRDIRFTTNGRSLYAIVLDWPGKQLVIRSLRGINPEAIESVTMLGNPETIHWQVSSKGMVIRTPIRRPGDHAYTYKIVFRQSIPRTL